jgi:hypothetical protein
MSDLSCPLNLFRQDPFNVILLSRSMYSEWCVSYRIFEQTPHAFISSPTHATCHAHLRLHHYSNILWRVLCTFQSVSGGILYISRIAFLKARDYFLLFSEMMVKLIHNCKSLYRDIRRRLQWIMKWKGCGRKRYRRNCTKMIFAWKNWEMLLEI